MGTLKSKSKEQIRKEDNMSPVRNNIQTQMTNTKEYTPARTHRKVRHANISNNQPRKSTPTNQRIIHGQSLF